MSELFYNFTLDGKNRGYTYLYLDSKKLQSVTRFRLAENEIFTNEFTLKLKDGDVVACKHGNLPWVDLSRRPPNQFPSCAYPLLLPRAAKNNYTYVQISEDDGTVIGETLLKREFGEIFEVQNEVVRRRFTMKGETPNRIDWGGPVSHICLDRDDCVRGSGINFVVE